MSITNMSDNDEDNVDGDDVIPTFEDKTSAIEHLKKNYKNINSPVCFQSISALKKIYRILSKRDIEDVLSTYESYSLMKPLNYRKKTNPFIALHIRDVFQADLIKVSELSQHNDGINHILCCIDIFSKRLWCVPILAATGEATCDGLAVILSTINIYPKTFIFDKGPEFANNKLKRFASDQNIRVIYSKSEHKAMYAEAVQRTIQFLIYTYITEYETLR